MCTTIVVLGACTLFVSSIAYADTIVNGDLKLSGGGDLVFSDGSVQTKAQMQGPAGLISLPYSGSASSATPVFEITNTGTGRAGVFTTTNPANSLASVAGFTVSGTGVYGAASGSGWAGVFKILNAANGNPALYASTIGTGPVASIQSTNTANNSPALNVITNGTGKAGVFTISNPSNNHDEHPIQLILS